MLFYRNYKKKASIASPSSLLIMIYLISFLSAGILFLIKPYEIDLEATLYLCLLLLLFIWPFYSYNETKVNIILWPNPLLVRFISVFLIIFNLMGIIVFLEIISKFIFQGFTDISLLRNSANSGEFTKDVGFFYSLSIIFAYMYPITLLFYVYYFNEKNRLLKNLLFIASLSYPIYTMSNMGRDGILLYFIVYYFYYLLFRKIFSIEQRKEFLYPIYKLGFIFGIIFYIITLGRFSSDEGPLYAIFSYQGQQLGNFTTFYIQNIQNSTIGSTNFSYFLDRINAFGFTIKAEDMSEFRLSTIKSKGFDVNVFSTLIGSFLLDFGKTGTLVFGIIYNIVVNLFLFKKQSLKFYDLFLFSLFIIIPMQGVYYFLQYVPAGNIYILISIFLYFIFRIFK